MSATIGTYADGGTWIAVCVLDLDGEHVLVDERHAHPDDPDAGGTVVRHYREREAALAEGAARVLALGGWLDAEPEQVACSRVRGQARAQLRPFPRSAWWREPDGRDSTPVERAQAERMLGVDLGGTCTCSAPPARGERDRRGVRAPRRHGRAPAPDRDHGRADHAERGAAVALAGAPG
jgi:hypothetical protein